VKAASAQRSNRVAFTGHYTRAVSAPATRAAHLMRRGLRQRAPVGYDAHMETVEIRAYRESDWPAVWAIIQRVVAAGETYAYDPAWTEEQTRGVWVEPPPGHTVVACAGARVLGTAKMGPNRPGPGAHVATASFMVAEEARGRGVGHALGEYALAWARAHGYAAMQFNAVVETNTAAVRLWQVLGFRIIGTVPEAFTHPTRGRVGLHIMHRYL
jgi:GNAT superfamily N-acetyltransferase